LQTICPDWLWTAILLNCASWVARITGVSHWCLSYFVFFNLLCFGFWDRVVLFSPWLALNLRSFCLCLQSARIPGICHCDSSAYLWRKGNECEKQVYVSVKTIYLIMGCQTVPCSLTD
jgi:hypothetical protein